MQYDASTHLLWAGDTGGRLTAWALCPVLRHHRLVNVSKDSGKGLYHVGGGGPPPEVRLRDDADQHTPHTQHCGVGGDDADHGLVDDRVALRRSWRAHRDDVFALHAHAETATLVSSGGDRRVLLWSAAGVLLAELRTGRHYPGGYRMRAGPPAGRHHSNPLPIVGSPPPPSPPHLTRRRSSAPHPLTIRPPSPRRGPSPPASPRRGSDGGATPRSDASASRRAQLRAVMSRSRPRRASSAIAIVAAAAIDREKPRTGSGSVTPGRRRPPPLVVALPTSP
eukprot:gene52269-57431_t